MHAQFSLTPFPRALATLFILALGYSAIATAQAPTAAAVSTAVLSVPGYGPGVAGHISVGPITPVCVIGVPCTRPYVGASVQLLDNATRAVVGSAATNNQGAFITSVPSGSYLVHIPVIDVFPRCPETPVTVGRKGFVLVHVECDTGIR